MRPYLIKETLRLCPPAAHTLNKHARPTTKSTAIARFLPRESPPRSAGCSVHTPTHTPPSPANAAPAKSLSLRDSLEDMRRIPPPENSSPESDPPPPHSKIPPKRPAPPRPSGCPPLRPSTTEQTPRNETIAASLRHLAMASA